MGKIVMKTEAQLRAQRKAMAKVRRQLHWVEEQWQTNDKWKPVVK